MSDYNNYIDSRVEQIIRIADEVGDHRLSLKLRVKMLSKLKQYRGQDWTPISMASALTSQIQHLRSKPMNKKPILKNSGWDLSKTTFLLGLQCEKSLYLNKYKKDQATPHSQETKKLFWQGHEFEEHVRKNLFPYGKNIIEKVGFVNLRYAKSYTDYLLRSGSTSTIFEATFIEDGIMAMVDILHKKDHNSYDFYEIKAYTELNKVVWDDLIIQYYICKRRFGDQINSFNLVLRDKETEWKIIDLKKELEEKIMNIKSDIERLKAVLKKSEEPKIEMGRQCNDPYDCVFIDYCKRTGETK